MHSREVHRTSVAALSVLASGSLVLALAACTVSTVPAVSATATATPAPRPTPTLTCAYTFVPIPPLLERPSATVPFVGDEAELLCLVTGAPSSDTSFTLTFVITGPEAPPNAVTSSPCTGTLHQGKGACAQTYFLPVGFSGGGPTGTTDQPFTSFVYGFLHPSGQRLGPVIPIFAASQ